MVEEVEDFRTELEILGLTKSNLLVDGEIPVIKARTAADGALSAIVKLAERRIRKIIRVEIVTWRSEAKRGVGLPGIQYLERRNQTWSLSSEEEQAIDQLVVIFCVQTDRKTALKLRDA